MASPVFADHRAEAAVDIGEMKLGTRGRIVRKIDDTFGISDCMAGVGGGWRRGRFER